MNATRIAIAVALAAVGLLSIGFGGGVLYSRRLLADALQLLTDAKAEKTTAQNLVKLAETTLGFARSLAAESRSLNEKSRALISNPGGAS